MTIEQNNTSVSGLTSNDEISKKDLLVGYIKNHSTSIGISALLIVIAATTYGVYTNVQHTKLVKLEGRELQILKKDSEHLGAFNAYSSIENQKAYLDQVEQTLSDETLADYTRNLLLIRKAATLATLRGSTEQDAYVQEATDIFKQFINTEGTDEGTVYLRDFAIIAGVKLYTQCCFTASLFDKKSQEFLDKRKIGYTDAMTELIKLDELSQKVSPARRDDITNITNKFAIYLMLLGRYKDKLSPTDYEKIYKELGETLTDYGQAQAIIFKDPANASLRSTNHYVAAYDRFHSLSAAPLTKEKNALIDTKYAEGLQKIKDTESIANNTPLINEMLSYHLIGYISSLERRYGSKVDNALQQELLKQVAVSLSSSKEVEAIFKTYFLASLRSPDFKSSTLYHFFIAGMKYAKTKEYLYSLGITESRLSR